MQNWSEIDRNDLLYVQKTVCYPNVFESLSAQMWRKIDVKFQITPAQWNIFLQTIFSLSAVGLFDVAVGDIIGNR